MKKFISIIMLISLIMILTGCFKSTPENKGKSDTITIVATIFPEYDWLRELTKGSDNVSLKLMLDKGTDLHSYQPSADDIITMTMCDMLVYVGGESDEWVNDILAASGTENRMTVSLMELMGGLAKEETLLEGMEKEEEEAEDEEAEDESELDEHVWLSLKNAQVLCQKLAEHLATIDPKNVELYLQNCTEYIDRLQKLDTEYAEAVETAQTRVLLFGDRFPFRYMSDDYGLTCYAAFAGCSAASEASFETIAFLAQTVDKEGLKAVCTSGSDFSIAQAVISNTAAADQQIVEFDSMQSVTADMLENTTYLGIMESNLNAFKTALGKEEQP